ncbi:MAG TPA: hypothetical protein P5280_12995 [Cyclobacteriaceae bacterium]|nr:hypothetical protein [Cyclobacteriaceae bacterium]
MNTKLFTLLLIGFSLVSLVLLASLQSKQQKVKVQTSTLQFEEGKMPMTPFVMVDENQFD